MAREGELVSDRGSRDHGSGPIGQGMAVLRERNAGESVFVSQVGSGAPQVSPLGIQGFDGQTPPVPMMPVQLGWGVRGHGGLVGHGWASAEAELSIGRIGVASLWGLESSARVGVASALQERLEARAESLLRFSLDRMGTGLWDSDMVVVEAEANAIIRESNCCVGLILNESDGIAPIELDRARVHAQTGALTARAVGSLPRHIAISIASEVQAELALWTASVGRLGEASYVIVGGVAPLFPLLLDWKEILWQLLKEYWEWEAWLLGKLLSALGLDFLIAGVEGSDFKGVIDAIKDAADKGDEKSAKSAAKAVGRAIRKAASKAAKGGAGKAARAAAKAATSAAAMTAFLAWFIYDVVKQCCDLLWDWWNDEAIGDNPLYKAATYGGGGEGG